MIKKFYEYNNINQYTPQNKKSGYWEEYYYKGNIKYKGSYVNDCKDGDWEEYYDNGNIKSKGKYDINYRDGIWEEYYENRILKNRIEYHDDFPNGKSEYYYDNGNILSKGNYINGSKEGYWKTYHITGTLQSEGYYKNSNKEGFWNIYNSNGKIHDCGNYINSNQNGCWNRYENGNLTRKFLYNNSICICMEEYEYIGTSPTSILKHQKRGEFYFYDDNFNNFKEKWLKLTKYELLKLKNIVPLVLRRKENKYFYMIDDDLNFIVKLEDDYYYICYNGSYTKYDQFSTFIKQLKKVRNI